MCRWENFDSSKWLDCPPSHINCGWIGDGSSLNRNHKRYRIIQRIILKTKSLNTSIYQSLYETITIYRWSEWYCYISISSVPYTDLNHIHMICTVMSFLNQITNAGFPSNHPTQHVEPPFSPQSLQYHQMHPQNVLQVTLLLLRKWPNIRCNYTSNINPQPGMESIRDPIMTTTIHFNFEIYKLTKSTSTRSTPHNLDTTYRTSIIIKMIETTTYLTPHYYKTTHQLSILFVINVYWYNILYWLKE